MKNYQIKNKYLAEAMSWLGFRYYKTGFGKDTIYTFIETEEFKKCLSDMLEYKQKNNISR